MDDVQVRGGVLVGRATLVVLSVALVMGVMSCDRGSAKGKGGTTSATKAGALESTGGATSATPVEEPRADEGRHVIVWMGKRVKGEDSPVYTSEWLQVAAGGEAKVLGEREGLFVASEAGLYEVGLKVKTQKMYDCNMATMEAGDLADVQLESLTVKELLGGKEQSFDPLPDPKAKDKEMAGDYDENLVVEGSLGPYLFVTMNTYHMPFGAAHGSSHSTVVVYGLQKGAVVEGLVDVSAYDKERAAAFEELMKGENDLFSKSAEELKLTMYEPQVDAGSGAVQMKLQFTGETCYACSDGKWSAYTMSTQRVVELPEELLGYTKLPAGLEEAWGERAKGEEVGMGWSEVPADKLEVARAKFLGAGSGGT